MNVLDGARERIDKWLWHARFFRSRSGAARVCAAGRIRVNGIVVRRPHHALRPGDVLTLPLADRVRVVRVLALALRRGPAAEARTLYEEI